MAELLGPLVGILLVDLALSGDNALVIGAAAAGLERRQRWLAIVAGGGGAIVLRILFAAAASLLLTLPLLQAIGGVLLLFIAVRLLAGRDAHQTSESDAHAPTKGFAGALVTILLADVTMSLDNVLAIGALAHGNIPLLAIGLVLSIGLLLVGSAVLAELIGRLPWLLDLAALVLGWTAANMLLHDQRIGHLVAGLPGATIWVHAVGLGIVLAVDVILRRRASARRAVSGAPSSALTAEREQVRS